MTSPQPGHRFILRRPYGGKDEPDVYWLVEIGTRKPPRPYSSDNPADNIELLQLGRCDELGNIIVPNIPPQPFFVPPGTLEDTRYYTPIRVEKAEAA